MPGVFSYPQWLPCQELIWYLRAVDPGEPLLPGYLVGVEVGVKGPATSSVSCSWITGAEVQAVSEKQEVHSSTPGPLGWTELCPIQIHMSETP